MLESEMMLDAIQIENHLGYEQSRESQSISNFCGSYEVNKSERQRT